MGCGKEVCWHPSVNDQWFFFYCSELQTKQLQCLGGPMQLCWRCQTLHSFWSCVYKEQQVTMDVTRNKTVTWFGFSWPALLDSLKKVSEDIAVLICTSISGKTQRKRKIKRRLLWSAIALPVRHSWEGKSQPMRGRRVVQRRGGAVLYKVCVRCEWGR